MAIKLSVRKFKRILTVVFITICCLNIFKLINYCFDLQTQIKEEEETTDASITHEDYDFRDTIQTQHTVDNRNKYILLVTSKVPKKYPFTMFHLGNTVFKEHDCEFTNCFVTSDRTYINESAFDMVAFDSADLLDIEIPIHRTFEQKYAFFSFESAQYNPVCVDIYDDFFNWTFTYKLNSDYRWWFFDIFNSNETKIGPPVDVWPDFEPIGDDLKFKLDSKTRMAAWFVSNCETLNGREWVAKELDDELRFRYGWSIDVYGRCGTFDCPRRYAELCSRRIEENYFFYLAFENSFADDYVTEKILLGLKNLAIPVVYGAVNYSRFLPPGSYLDAKKLGTQELARMMNKIATHREILYDYFKWTEHITFRHIPKRSQMCGLCSLLNDKNEMAKTTLYPEFRNWWNNDDWDQSCTMTHDYF